jgi:hypothetical protein
LKQHGWEHLERGELSESERVFRESLNTYGGADDQDSLLGEKFGLAMALVKQKKYAEAESYILDVVPINSIPAGHGAQSFGAMRVLIEALEGQNKQEEAKKQVRRTFTLAEDIGEPEREVLLARLKEFLLKLNANLLDA